MIDACALYFPTDKLPLKTVIPNGRSDAGFFRAATWFEYDPGDGPIRLSLHHENLAEHLRGFKAYVAQLPNSGEARSKAQALISRTRASVGVVLPHPVALNSTAFNSLVDLLGRFDGFMFVRDSIMLPDRSYLVGPMADIESAPPASSEPTLATIDPDQCLHLGSVDGAEPSRIAMREAHCRSLAERGFRCARWLPLYRSADRTDAMRPLPEIVGRLLALEALFLWVAASEDVASSTRLRGFISQNDLLAHLTEEEAAILALPRDDARQKHTDRIGWRLENMWALSWVLGFEPAPPFSQGQLPQAVIDAMLFEFLPDLDGTIPGFLAEARVRAAAEVGRFEDLYYCAHNAVRSAQLGESTVPIQFHPVRDGGAIHERRHSLTWVLSPGTPWEETDLST